MVLERIKLTKYRSTAMFIVKYLVLAHAHCFDFFFFFLSGYAADDITHCIRPQDIKERRAVIILRK